MKKKNIVIVNRQGVIVTGVTERDDGWEKLVTNQAGNLVSEIYFQPHWCIDNHKHEISCPITLVGSIPNG